MKKSEQTQFSVVKEVPKNLSFTNVTFEVLWSILISLMSVVLRFFKIPFLYDSWFLYELHSLAFLLAKNKNVDKVSCFDWLSLVGAFRTAYFLKLFVVVEPLQERVRLAYWFFVLVSLLCVLGLCVFASACSSDSSEDSSTCEVRFWCSDSSRLLRYKSVMKF